jgi:hypothetical protein
MPTLLQRYLLLILKCGIYDGSQFNYLKWIAESEDDANKTEAQATIALLLEAKAFNEKPIAPPGPPTADQGAQEEEPATAKAIKAAVAARDSALQKAAKNREHIDAT